MGEYNLLLYSESTPSKLALKSSLFSKGKCSKSNSKLVKGKKDEFTQVKCEQFCEAKC